MVFPLSPRRFVFSHRRPVSGESSRGETSRHQVGQSPLAAETSHHGSPIKVGCCKAKFCFFAKDITPWFMNVYDMLKPDLIRAVLFTMISEVQLEGVISDVPGRKVEGRLTVKPTAGFSEASLFDHKFHRNHISFTPG